MRLSGVVVTMAALGSVSLGVAGCGDSTSASQAPSPLPTVAATNVASASACGDVWAPGKKLRGGYAGCLLNGHLVAAHKRSCSSGQVLVTYGNAYYAVIGGPVQHVPGLANSKVYKKMMRACDG